MENRSTALSNLFMLLADDDLSILYSGGFNDSITSKAISLSEINIANADNGFVKMRKKASFLMAECFQNIVRHHDKKVEKTELVGRNFFSTRKVDTAFIISSANVIKEEDSNVLVQKLEQVNKLEKDELKQLYMHALSNNELSDKGGAGLGLIEMARKSGNKLKYDIKEIKDGFYHFYLQLGLGDVNTAKSDYLRSNKALHELLIKNNLFLVYKGDLSKGSFESILNMAESNLDGQIDKDSALRKKVSIVLIELLKNISKHSLKRNGIQTGLLAVGKKGNKFIIGAGNVIKNEEVEPLKEQLKKLQQVDQNSLTETSGLEEIAQNVREPFEFDFTPRDKDRMLYSIFTVI